MPDDREQRLADAAVKLARARVHFVQSRARLENTMGEVTREVHRLYEAIMASGVTLGYHDEYHAEGGRRNERC